MRITRQHVAEVLRKAGLAEMADDALRELPEEMDPEQATAWGVRYGLDLGELVNRMGGSP